MNIYVIAFIESYLDYWRRAFDFKGRTTRSYYWSSVLIGLIAGMILWIPYYDFFLQLITRDSETYIPLEIKLFTWLNYLPMFSMNIRRLRDIGKSWKCIFIILIPLFGPLWFFLQTISPSKEK